MANATSAQTIERELRTGQALDYRRAGLSYQQIAETLHVAKSTVYKDVSRALRGLARQNDEKTAELRQLELERLDALQRAAWRVLNRDHVYLYRGEVVTEFDPHTGQQVPLVDDGPTLAAILVLVRLSERRSRLLGLDRPVEVEGTSGPPSVLRIIRCHIPAELPDGLELEPGETFPP